MRIQGGLCWHQIELRSSKPHSALAPPPPEITVVQVDVPLENVHVQVDESESFDASKDSYYNHPWLLRGQHESLAECDVADSEYVIFECICMHK